MSRVIPTRIATARIEAGYDTAERFGAVIGVSGQAVRDWERGKATPRPANLERIMEVTGKSVSYFYGEERNDDNLADRLEHLIAQAQAQPAGEMIAIPVYSHIAATSSSVPDEQPIEYRHEPRAHLPAGHEENCYFARIRNDSLVGLGISEGDLVFCVTGVPVESGNMAVIRTGETYTISRVQELDGVLLLMRDNRLWRIDGNNVEIMARVMWARKDF